MISIAAFIGRHRLARKHRAARRAEERMYLDVAAAYHTERVGR